MSKNSKLIEKVDLWVTNKDHSISRIKDVSVIFTERLDRAVEELCTRLYVMDEAMKEKGLALRMHEIVSVIREELSDNGE